MFEAPIFPVKEYTVNSARAALNGRFIFDEGRSVVEKEESGTQDFIPGSAVTRRVRESRKRKRKTEQEEEEGGADDNGTNEYKGLYTRGLYTPTGELQSHILSRPFDPSERQFASYPYDLYMNGLEPMPRPASPLKVVRDSPQTYASMNEFSPGVRRIVTKNNVPKDADTSILSVTVEEEDSWLRNSLKLRHTHIVSSIVHLSMLRGDYSLASRAFALLIRASNVDIRVTWTIGLELLVWRREMRQQQRNGPEHNDGNEELPNNGDIHTQPSRLQRKEDDDFMEWLVVNYPHLAKRRASKWKYRSRAPDFYPHLILSKMRGGDPNDALDRLRELLLESPYSDTPLFYALAGIATIQLLTIEQHKNNTTKIHQLVKEAHAYFDKCVALGGIYPSDFIDFELLQFTQDNSE